MVTAMIYEDICQTIGRTPVVRIQRLAPSGVTIFVKVEAANPGGSVKDRLAIGIMALLSATSAFWLIRRRKRA